MQVLFLQNVKGIAQMGEFKNVANGYGKFLISQGLVKKTDKSTLHQAHVLSKKRGAKQEERDEWVKEIISKTKDIVIEIFADANEEGHLYGSVSAKQIAIKAQEQGIMISADDILLEHGLKELGEYVAQLDLTSEYKGGLKVSIKKTF